MSVPIVNDVLSHLAIEAPLELAESWDNVGLLLGDRAANVSKLMTCLTVSESTVREAIAHEVQLVVSHHPIPFRPLQRIETSDPTGHCLWLLARAGISVYSPHTAWDNAPRGINQMLAEIIALETIAPLVPKNLPHLPGLGTGRVGSLAAETSIELLLQRLELRLGVLDCQVTAMPTAVVKRVAIVCGSGASLLNEASRTGCDTFLTGEATYHQSLEALHRGMSLLCIGHHSSERFAMDQLAQRLQSTFPMLEVWASKNEFDPVKRVPRGSHS